MVKFRLAFKKTYFLQIFSVYDNPTMIRQTATNSVCSICSHYFHISGTKPIYMMRMGQIIVTAVQNKTDRRYAEA